MSNAENTGASLLDELSRLDRLEIEIADTETHLANLKEDFEATGIRAKGLFTNLSSVLARFTLPMPDPVEPIPVSDPVVMDPEPVEPTPEPTPAEPTPEPAPVEPTPEPVPTPAEPVTTVGDLATDPITEPEVEDDESFLDMIEDEPEVEAEPAPADPAPEPPVKGIP